MTVIRGIRGAVRITDNSREAIFTATLELLQKVVHENKIDSEDVASVFLTATPDLNAEFPAYAVREMGWSKVPLLCAQEIAVQGAMTRVIRVLLHVNTTKSQGEIRHLYLGDTQKLRPDIANAQESADDSNGVRNSSTREVTLLDSVEQDSIGASTTDNERPQ